MTIQITGLGKRFNRDWIFRNLSIELVSGSCTAVLGPNGSGKSTLLSVLWNQVPQSEGSFNYLKNGVQVEQDSIFNFITIAAPYLELPEELSLQEILDFHFRFKKPASGMSLETIQNIIGLVGTGEKPFREFSSGMKQRLKVGLALLSDASVTFLDEPTTNLDEQGIQWYQGLLQNSLKPGLGGILRTIVIATNTKEDYLPGTSVIQMNDYK
ncbi:MAG: ATP-binding cassette domain-containing protein [Bacteroidetes bacterium]|nr:ATP-binding cassette domain-containing protein [Bacteroidota bacterium]